MRARTLLLGLGGAALLLAGCTAVTPAQQAAAIEVSLTALETQAAVYEAMPQASPATVAKIKAADTAAFNAVEALQAGGDVAAADSAVAALAADLAAAKTN